MWIKKKQNYFIKKLKKQSDLNASDRFLQQRKKLNGLHFIKIRDERSSSRPEFVDQFKNKLQTKIKELDRSPDQIYNTDESQEKKLLF